MNKQDLINEIDPTKFRCDMTSCSGWVSTDTLVCTNCLMKYTSAPSRIKDMEAWLNNTKYAKGLEINERRK